jgi:hypothetical protein
VAFTSSADNLAAADTNKSQDVFVRDLQTGTTVLASVNTNSTCSGNGPSYSPILSAEGRYLLFRSQAKNLAGGPFSFNSENLFFRDLQANTTSSLTTNGVLAATMTPDGHFVAFNSENNLYLWDSLSATRVFTNNVIGALDRIAISPDTQRIVVLGSLILRAIDRQISSNWTIASPVYAPSRAGLRFSADGRFLAYEGSAGYTNSQVLLYDFVTRASLLISQSPSSSPGNGNSDSPGLSPDARFVIYRSFATNIVSITNNSLPNLFLQDRVSGKTTLLTESRFGGGPPDNRSLKPVLSADGRAFFFQSWASDLVGQDFNHNSDVFSFALLYCSIVPGMAPGQGPTISWPARPGESYDVQFKNNLSDSTWQEVSGSITVEGNEARITDLAPASGQRFYRVVAF